MGKFTKKNHLPFADAIFTIIEPIIKALDENPNYNAGVSGDTGHDRPSQRDVGLRILLDSWIRPLHNQLHGNITSSDNRKILNVTERMMESETQVAAHRDRFAGREEDMLIDPSTFRINHWYEVNENRYNAYREMYDSLRLTYKQVTGEDWKYVEIGGRGQAVDASKMADAEKAKMLARFTGERKLVKKEA